MMSKNLLHIVDARQWEFKTCLPQKFKITEVCFAQKIPDSGLWLYARIDQKANEKSKSVLKKAESLDNFEMKKMIWDLVM